MMDSALNCSGWLMAVAGIATYGVLALAGAALVKYLFFTKGGDSGHSPQHTAMS